MFGKVCSSLFSVVFVVGSGVVWVGCVSIVVSVVGIVIGCLISGFIMFLNLVGWVVVIIV